jgi:peptidoglycan glycosyltransferase
VNKSISKLYIVVILLFALLIVWTSRWTVFDSSALANNKLNQLSYFATIKVKRGEILARDGKTVLAKSVSAGGGTWKRTYPQGSLFAQTIGYANVQQGQFSGLEQEYLKQLENRQQTTFSSVFGPISTSNLGNDLYTTLDPTAQALAQTQLAGRVGSVVAIVPQTGDVVAMYSNPAENDNNDVSHLCDDTPAISDLDLNPSYNTYCQLDLATQGEFAPGSTFKVITTAAALNTGKYTPDSEIAGPSPLTVSGKPLENDGNTSYPDETLTYALTNSINTIYAQLGLNLGRATMEDYMKRFGFYKKPPIDLPSDQLLASGERSTNGNLLLPTSTDVDLGRMSIGQDKLAVTPLQMGMVVATVADGGKLMEPRLATKVVNPDGQVVDTIAPKLDDQVMTAQTASELGQMMTKVVEEGTGQAAQLEGLTGEVAGKTGTATVGGTASDPLDDSWFIGFAPVSDPKIAVAVVLRNIPNGYGGTYAAPIAAAMMKTLLAENL